MPDSGQLLSPTTAFLLCGFFTLSYVVSLYLASAGRLVFRAPPVNVPNGQERVRLANEQWRNDPSVIKARLRAVTISTLLSMLTVGFVVIQTAKGSMSTQQVIQSVLLKLGFIRRVSPDFEGLILPHIITPVFFVGPLFIMFLSEELPLQPRWSWKADVIEKFTSWQGIRNFTVAPITEELVFRACILSVMKMACASQATMIFAAPLWFGLAHLHHAWGLYNMYGKTKSALQRAVLTALVQLTYTTVFGWFTSWLFITSGYIYPSITSHIFCNIMGLPSPGYYGRIFPKYKIPIWMMHISPFIGFFASIYMGPR